MKAVLWLMIFAVSVPASAQRLELTPLMSYTTAAPIYDTAPGVDDLEVAGGASWGAEAMYFVAPRIGVEGLWTYQSTDLTISAGAVSTPVFTMTTNQVLGNLVYHLGNPSGSWTPFVFGGIGITHFASSAPDSDTRLAWTAGAGIKWFVRRHLGFKAQARFRPTVLRDSSSTFCGPFGFCQGSLQHFEFGGGAVLRF